jgi:hypothetical protein
VRVMVEELGHCHAAGSSRRAPVDGHLGNGRKWVG